MCIHKLKYVSGRASMRVASVSENGMVLSLSLSLSLSTIPVEAMYSYEYDVLMYVIIYIYNLYPPFQVNG